MRLTPFAFAALLGLQVLPAAALVWQHNGRVASGRPVSLAVETRDPRDLFRGEYSVLTYEIGRARGLPASTAGLGAACDLDRRESCPIPQDRRTYLRLVPDADGVHRAVEARFERPGPDEVFIAGQVRSGRLVRRGGRLQRDAACEADVCLMGSITYGIERWYGQQGRPAKLDAAPRSSVLVEARLDPHGRAVLSGVRIGGQLFAHTSPLW